MEIGNLILTPSAAVAGVATLAVAGATLWWLVRKRQKRVWLPTIRIMRLESYVLPRLVLRPPPLVGFLCFLAAALVLLGFAMRPRTQVFTPFEPNQTRIHVFCDLSPSVSAYVTLDEYAARMAALYVQLKDAGRITVSTSAGPQVAEPQSAEEMAAAVRQTGFHRAGLRLGTAMKALLAERSDIDRLIVVSDRDQHSWTDFNWQYLTDEMDVVLYDLTDGHGAKAARGGARNVFINDARYLSSPASTSMDWDVEVARSGEAGEIEGKLDVTYMGKQLGTFPWKLPADRRRINVRATWPGAAVTAIDKSGVRDVPLVFRLAIDGGDLIALDNEFRTGLRGLKQDVLLVSESTGERALEDPAEQLEVSLAIQGFRTRRLDTLAQPGPAADEYPFVVLLGGGAGSVDRYCPKSFERARLAEKGRQGNAVGHQRALPRLWLAPQTPDASYRDLCRCYSRLLLSQGATESEPAYCQTIQSRSQWLGLLPSLGAKQVGGQVGDWSKALAWHGRDQTSGLDVLAFTVPLTPSPATGLNHAQMPILVKELLTWQGIIETATPGGGGWPRIEDIFQKVWQPDATLEPEALTRLRATNVPLGESLLAEMDEAQLPPRWTSAGDWVAKRVPSKKDREDPLPWLKLAAGVVVAVAVFEGLYGLVARLLRFIDRRSATSGAALLLLLCAGLGASRAEAKIGLNLLGYGGGSWTLSMLAREVQHRTSIDLETRPLVSPHLTPEALGEPWLWVHDLSLVTSADGALRPDVVTWLRRGGFLVIEGAASGVTLARLTTALHASGSEDGWQPLPPDHEMMRSFYLLDALPACNGEIWRGFHYDGRLAVLAVPYGFLGTLRDHGAPAACANPPDQERSVRVFVNLIMVALATDYKKDQIHLPEILKRLR